MNESGPRERELSSEAALLVRVARKDREAFAALFLLAAPRVKSYIMRLGSDAATAEEVVQDVMLTVWRKADRFDPVKATAYTWIFVIARNRRIDMLRRERATVVYGVEFPEAPDEETPLASDAMAASQRDASVRDAMADLSPEQQEVVRRAFFEEEPHTVIAAALDLPLGTVKSRLRLAFKKLRDRLEDVQK